MKKTIIIIITIILLIVVMGTVDSNRFSNNKKPIFILKQIDYKDGGTTFYYGLGYQLIDWHILNFDELDNSQTYLTKKEFRIFPFLKYRYNIEEIDKNNFIVEYK